MKKVLIFYASYGGGHLSAAKSIENYLIENFKDINVELIDCVKYINKAFEKITTTAYKEMAKKAPWVWGKLYRDAQKGPIAHISSRANSFMAIKLIKLLREKAPDIIISTHPFGSQMCNYLRRKQKIGCKLATILTDFKSHEQWIIGHESTDLFFVSNENMRQELVEKNVDSNKIHVTGIPIRNDFLKNHNKKEILNELNFSENKKTILLFAGGEFGLGKNKVTEVLNSLAQNFKNTQIIAVSGRNENMKKEFRNIVIKNQREADIHILEFTDKVADFMAISDLVITKPGGLTTSESLVSGLPLLIINPIPGQEEENAEFLENARVAKWLKKEDDINFILNILLNDENILNNMKQNIKNIAKPNSTKDICNIILKDRN